MEGQAFVKGLYRGTIRLVRLDGPDVAQLYDRFGAEFDGAEGRIVYKDGEGDIIPIVEAKDLEYAFHDAQQRGGMVKLQYESDLGKKNVN